jgi:GntR family transcriptional regulator
MNIIISNGSDMPIYMQILEQIKEAIISGKLQQNELLPSIRSLAKELNISVITTKRAYEELDRQGFIQTVPGKGSYVSFFNKELIYEDKLKEIEMKLQEAINASRIINISKEELIEILNCLYEE